MRSRSTVSEAEHTLACTECGVFAEADSRFCAECGTPFPEPVADAEAAVPEDAPLASETNSISPLPTSDVQCPACGVPSAGGAFCVECGTALSQGMAPVTSSDDASGRTTSTPMATSGDALVGQTVGFRSLSRRDRTLRTEPSEHAPVLPGYIVGKSVVQGVAGDWVFLLHSSGTTGWCERSAIRLAGASSTAVRPSPGSAVVPPTTTGGPARPPVPPNLGHPALAPESSDRGTGPAMIEALERLSLLHRSGALTDDEFARAKATLLDEGSI
jgi:hypothetical protein